MLILLGNFLSAIAGLLHMVLFSFMWVLIARAVLSWVNPDPYNGIVRFINSLTEPILRHIRMRVPPLGMLDLSVFIALIIIYFLDNFLVMSMYDYALKIKGVAQFSAPGFS